MWTILYWLVFAVTAFLIAKEIDERAWMNVMGYEKMNGKWQRVMIPDHYCFPLTVGIYYLCAATLILGLWAISSLILYYVCPNINTGFYRLLEFAFVVIRQCAK